MALPKVGDGYQVSDGNVNEGVNLGVSTGLIGFYGKTPITQRTASVATSAVGTASSADVTTSLKAAVLDIMNTLEALGLWKAS